MSDDFVCSGSDNYDMSDDFVCLGSENDDNMSDEMFVQVLMMMICLMKELMIHSTIHQGRGLENKPTGSHLKIFLKTQNCIRMKHTNLNNFKGRNSVKQKLHYK